MVPEAVRVVRVVQETEVQETEVQAMAAGVRDGGIKWFWYSYLDS